MALVLDRIFFYLFFIVCIVGTAGTKSFLCQRAERDFKLAILHREPEELPSLLAALR